MEILPGEEENEHEQEKVEEKDEEEEEEEEGASFYSGEGKVLGQKEAREGEVERERQGLDRVL